MKPKVSVIVPNYNHAPYLEQRIESILNQSYQDFELILLDDCSTDNSLEVLSKYANHPKVSHYIVNKQNSGSTFKQWDKGINLAKGEWIWIAESDDWAEREFLEKMTTHLTENPSIGVSFCNSNWVDASNKIGNSLSLYKDSFVKNGLEVIKTDLLYRNIIQNTSSALIRKSCLKKLNREYLKMKSCGDWFFYIQILISCDLLYDNTILNNFRWYHNNTSNITKKQGLWTIEGLQILKFGISNVTLSNSDKYKITSKWTPELLQLKVANISLFKMINLFRLFTLSPKRFLKIYFTR